MQKKTLPILALLFIIVNSFHLEIVQDLKGYDSALGQKLARLCLASYCKKSQVQKWDCTPCRNSPLKMNNIQTFQNATSDTLGYIATSDQLDAIVLVFRGTLPWNLKNWLLSINMVTVYYPLCDNNCKVHKGFYEGYLQINKQILSTVAYYKQKFTHSKLIVTGHSLGAALATHTVAHLMSEQYLVDEFYNFGSPRVGNYDFTNWFNDQYGHRSKSRVTHYRDPVPHLPLKDWGFVHVKNQIFHHELNREGFVICKDEQAEDKNCSDKFQTEVTDVLDHLTYYDIDFAGIVASCQ